MNALANSQVKELEKFLRLGYPNKRGPVTFERYTDQESDEERQRIIANPPDILPTNYVMLELILTPPPERRLLGSKPLKSLAPARLASPRGPRSPHAAPPVRL